MYDAGWRRRRRRVSVSRPVVKKVAPVASVAPGAKTSGRICFVIVVDSNPKCVMYARNALFTLRQFVSADDMPAFVVTDGQEVTRKTIPEADAVFDVSAQADAAGVRGLEVYRFPNIVFFKLLVPFLPELSGFSRAVVSDVDVRVVSAAVSNLAWHPMDGKVASAAMDVSYHTPGMVARLGKRAADPEVAPILEKKANGEYLNSGVVLWDLNRIRDGERTYRRVLAYGLDMQRELKFRWADQDVFNVVFSASVLPGAYNRHGSSADQPHHGNAIEHFFSVRSKPALDEVCRRNGFSIGGKNEDTVPAR